MPVKNITASEASKIKESKNNISTSINASVNISNNSLENEVAPPKRKRGRPPKKDKVKGIVANEGVEKIDMQTSQTSTQTSTIIPQNASKPVTFNDSDLITTQKVQQKWFNIFNKYNSAIGSGDLNTLLRSTNNAVALNPFVQNMRIRNINARGKNVSKTEIQQFLENPENNEDMLQGVAWNLYFQNYVFQSLVNLPRDVAMYNYYAVCEDLKPEKYGEDSFIKERKRVDEILKTFNPKTTFKDVTTAVSLEGKCVYFPRLSYDRDNIYYALLQKADANRIRLVGFGSETKFRVAMDLSIFLDPAYDVRQYPDVVGEAWDRINILGFVHTDKQGRKKIVPQANVPDNDFLELNGDTWAYWWFIPQGIVECFGSNNAHPYRFPDIIGLIPDVVELDDYKWLQAKTASKAATSIIAATIPLIAPANLKPGLDQMAPSSETILGFNQLFQDNVGDICYLYAAPYENYKFFDLSEQIPAAMSISSSRLKEVVDASGMSGLISLDSKPSIASVKTAQLLLQERVRYLRNQYEDFLNRFINNNFELKYKWNIKLWGEIFTFDEDMKLMKELIFNGVKGILPRYLSGYGLTITDYNSSYKEIESLGIKIIKDETIYQVENSKQMQRESIDANAKLQGLKIKDTGEVKTPNPVGRPKKPDSENDNTADGQDGGDNLAENRSFRQFTEEELSQYIDTSVISDLSNEELLEVLAEEILSQSENNHGYSQ